MRPNDSMLSHLGRALCSMANLCSLCAWAISLACCPQVRAALSSLLEVGSKQINFGQRRNDYMHSKAQGLAVRRTIAARREERHKNSRQVTRAATMSSLLAHRCQRRLFALILVVFIVHVSSWSPVSTSYLTAKMHKSQHHTRSSRLTTTTSSSSSVSATSLRMSNGGDDNKAAKKKTTGVYARPSAAIERGSGFFIPGLEGSRVRLLFGILALVLTYVNNSMGGVTTGGFGVSETVAVLAGILLLLQAAVEFGQELGFGVEQPSAASTVGGDGGGASAASSSSASANLEQRIAPSLVDKGGMAVDAIKWVAATYVALTPASHVIFVEDEGEGTEISLLYELGAFGNRGDGDSDTEIGARAAIDEVYKSKGGRISLPADHPAALGLLPESGRRCVLLQRISSNEGRRLCMVVGSNQLLQAFTKNDLRWLGRLAQYSGKVL